MSPPVLDGRKRRHLRALAHHQKVIVQVGSQGVTPGVVEALGAALTKHELVKLRMPADGEQDLEAIGAELARSTGSALAQTIGRVLLFYRPHPKKPRIVFPASEPPAAGRAR